MLIFNKYQCSKCKVENPDILLKVTLSTQAVGMKHQTETYESLENLNLSSVEYFCQDCFAGLAKAIEAFRKE